MGVVVALESDTARRSRSSGNRQSGTGGGPPTPAGSTTLACWSATAPGLRMRDSEALDEQRTADGRSLRAVPIDQPPGVAMPDEFEPRRLAKRTLQIVAVLAVVGLVLVLAPAWARSATC